MTFNYQEAMITFAAEEVPDLYAIHQRTLAVTNGNQRITYAPVGLNREKRMAVALRAMPDVEVPAGLAFENMTIEKNAILTIHAGVRLVKRSDFGERMPTPEEALEKWNAALAAGGFQAENARMVESAIAFHHKRLNQNTRLPFWAVSSTLTVVDAEQAAATMVRGVGRSRGLGFGMLRVVG
ncbi:MAG: type I-E CRISPR-associated protein Cas6/Cse3/CasE [Acidithiobacillus sp.]